MSKYHPAHVKVELEYRQPVCMVEVAGRVVRFRGRRGEHSPLDGFSPVETAKYPRHIGLDNARSAAGRPRWRQPGGGRGRIAEALLPVWEKMKLRSIEPYSPGESGTAERMPPAARGRLGEYHFVVRSQGGLQIFWGPSPALNAARRTGEGTESAET